MKTRASRITLVSLICLALLAAFSTSGAQVPTGPTLPQDAVEAPAQQIAPLRPGALEQPPHSKGFVPPPMDLSHLTGQRMPSVSVLQSLPSSWDWRAQGKVTLVKNQDACGSCYSFAAIANIESKMLIDGAGTFDFSENNAKECNWYELTNTAGGTSCSGGNYDLLANLFSKKGTVLESCDPYVASDVACKSGCPYQKTLLDWRIISGDAVPNTDVLKQYIYQYGPVYTSLYAGDGDAWETELQNYDGSYTLYYTGSEMPNHAVFIVGWDDSLSHTGGNGGWIVKNSWGTSWGDNGYFYIAYGSASIGKYSSFMYDWQDYDPTGDIMYYDEGGWSVSRGYGDTTAWGLAVFTSTVNTNITRVEFWTTDATTDVDVYIYDDFDGSAPTNLLRQSLDHSYNEAGYHSVPLALPLPVPAGNDVIAVVQFTNAVYPYPIPCDRYGPQETGRTYISHSGASGSWSASLYDVAIRLRTSSALAPDVGITKRVIGSDFAPGDPIAFTLTIANSGSEVAAHVVVTDVVPTEVLTPTFASTLALTPTGVLSYVWNVEPLGVGESGVITIYGWIDPGLGSGFSFTNTAIISDPEDNAPGNNTSTVTVGERKVYLPLVVRKYPPPPPSTFYSVGDACVLEGYPTTNLGNTSDMWAGYDDYLSPDGKIARSLIQFDVSAIPSGTSINSAVLRVYLVSSYDYPDKTRTITTYRIGSVWSESSATWNTHPSFAEAYGSASVTHGAWGWYSFDVTDLVRGWVNGTLSNYG
nr:DNRLRE domain-containing protein [Anaerolineae bacterium]